MTETVDFLKMLKRMIRAGGRRVGNSDEHDLKEFAELRKCLDNQLKKAILNQLSQGKSWSDIGFALGVTKQAAFKRFSK